MLLVYEEKLCKALTRKTSCLVDKLEINYIIIDHLYLASVRAIIVKHLIKRNGYVIAFYC